MADVNIPPAPGSAPTIPSDEELDKMSLEQLQALQKQLTPVQPNLQGPGALSLPEYNADVRKQVVPGLKEGVAGILGSPAEIANIGASTLSQFGDVPQSVEQTIRSKAAPYTAQEWQKWGPLKMSPEEQQPPKTFPGQVTRAFSSYLPATVPLGATGGLSGMVQALLRSGAAAGLSESGGYLADRLGSPEAANAMRAGGAALGFGPVRGFGATAAREGAADLLRGAGYPVSAAEQSGSRLAATLEQRPPVRKGIDELRAGKLDPQENNWAVRMDMGKVWQNASNSGAPATVVNPINRGINELQAAHGPKGKPISADEYFKLSKKWGDSNNPYVQQLGQVLDRHMAQQNPAWEGMRGRLENVPDLKSLSKAEGRLPFPDPYQPNERIGAIAAMAPLAQTLLGSGAGAPAAESAMLYALMGTKPSIEAGLSGLGHVARSPMGQAWMRGWPTKAPPTYAALLAGPAQRYLPDYSQQQQEVK